MKFLISLGIFVIIIYAIVSLVKRKVNKFFQNVVANQAAHTEPTEETYTDVIYKKDDVVVLKGDAKDEDDE